MFPILYPSIPAPWPPVSDTGRKGAISLPSIFTCRNGDLRAPAGPGHPGSDSLAATFGDFNQTQSCTPTQTGGTGNKRGRCPGDEPAEEQSQSKYQRLNHSIPGITTSPKLPSSGITCAPAPDTSISVNQLPHSDLETRRRTKWERVKICSIKIREFIDPYLDDPESLNTTALFSGRLQTLVAQAFPLGHIKDMMDVDMKDCSILDVSVDLVSNGGAARYREDENYGGWNGREQQEEEEEEYEGDEEPWEGEEDEEEEEGSNTSTSPKTGTSNPAQPLFSNNIFGSESPSYVPASPTIFRDASRKDLPREEVHFSWYTPASPTFPPGTRPQIPDRANGRRRSVSSVSNSGSSGSSDSDSGESRILSNSTRRTSSKPDSGDGACAGGMAFDGEATDSSYSDDCDDFGDFEGYDSENWDSDDHGDDDCDDDEDHQDCSNVKNLRGHFSMHNPYIIGNHDDDEDDSLEFMIPKMPEAVPEKPKGSGQSNSEESRANEAAKKSRESRKSYNEKNDKRKKGKKEKKYKKSEKSKKSKKERSRKEASKAMGACGEGT